MPQTFPTLFHKGKSGSIYSWSIWTEEDTILTEYGVVDGKKQVASKKATAKNIGRSNATSPKNQAEIEGLAMYQFKLDRKYSETPEAAEEVLFLPMLAQDFEKHKARINYPVYVQPKFDGVRCISRWEDGRVILLSRSGKPYDVPHIQKALESFLPPDTMFDGEIYLHDVTFQALTRLVKKYCTESLKLCYCVYDCVADGFEAENQTARNQRRSLSFQNSGSPLPFASLGLHQSSIVYVPSDIAHCEQDVREHQAHYLEQGYEGAMVRTLSNNYLFGYRSKDLLKVKTFEDAEFEIKGFTSGIGKFTNAVTWICVTPEGFTFYVTPVGNMEDRREWLEDGERYVGQLLKVKFFGKSEDGIPRFPIGLGVRLPEDM